MSTKKYKVPRNKVTQPEGVNYRLIPLTRGQVSIVDADDYDWLSQWNWHARYGPKNSPNSPFYVGRIDLPMPGVRKLVLMHRLILGCTKGEQADHINHNSLDNRRSNLRKVSTKQNAMNKMVPTNNTSGIKGVSWHRGRWRARIKANGHEYNLGNFHTMKEAALARDSAVRKYHGEFGFLQENGL